MKPRHASCALRRTASGLLLVAVLTTASPILASEEPATGEQTAPTPAPERSSSSSKAAARAEVQKAQLNYKLGRFDEALTGYSRAYEMFSAPALLFNIGQCHKNLKNYERAIFFFEGYLREATKADPPKRTLAQELITESRAELERQRAEEAAVAENRRAAAIAASTHRPAASSVSAVFGAPPPPPSTASLAFDSAPAAAVSPRQPLTHKWWFWTAIGVGALGMAGGLIGYYASGQTTTTLPMGSVGTLDRR